MTRMGDMIGVEMTLAAMNGRTKLMKQHFAPATRCCRGELSAQTVREKVASAIRTKLGKDSRRRGEVLESPPFLTSPNSESVVFTSKRSLCELLDDGSLQTVRRNHGSRERGLRKAKCVGKTNAGRLAGSTRLHSTRETANREDDAMR